MEPKTHGTLWKGGRDQTAGHQLEMHRTVSSKFEGISPRQRPHSELAPKTRPTLTVPLGASYLCIGNPIVTAQGQLQSSSKSHALDGGHHWLLVLLYFIYQAS